jgi:hypothetical protein
MKKPEEILERLDRLINDNELWFVRSTFDDIKLLLSRCERYEKILKEFAECAEWSVGDDEDCPRNNRACGIGCDMGESGRSKRGPGFHDDDCLIGKAREALGEE